MISKSFIKSSLLFTLGGALPMVAGILLLPFYTNYLSNTLYTQVLFYISISMLFQILFSFSIENYFGIKFTKLTDNKPEQKRFTGTVSVLLLIIGAVVLILACLIGSSLFSAIYKVELGMEFWPWGFFSVLTGFFNSYFKASSICLIYLKKPGTFLLSNLVNFFVTVVISVGGLFLFPDSLIGPMYGRLISGFVIFLIGLGIFKRNSVLIFDRSFLKDLFKFCIPYVFYVISGWLLMQVDRYILQAYIPNTELNAYDLLLKCFYGIEFIQNSLSAIIYPKVYEIWAKYNQNGTRPESNRYFNVLTAINLLLLIMFCIAIPWVYRLFVNNPAFFQSESYMGLLASGYALRSILSFYLAGILFTGNVMVLLRIFGFSVLVQIILTWPASHYFGLNGALIAGLVTKIVQVLLCIFLSTKVFEYKFNIAKILILPFSYLLVNVVQFYVQPEYNLWFFIIEFIGYGTLIYLLFSNEIKKVMVNFGRSAGN